MATVRCSEDGTGRMEWMEERMWNGPAFGGAEVGPGPTMRTGGVRWSAPVPRWPKRRGAFARQLWPRKAAVAECREGAAGSVR